MRNGRRQHGFTLIEMIVVIVILGLIGGLILSRGPWRSTGLNTEATVRALEASMRLARSRAIAQDRDVSIITGTFGFSIDGEPPWVLPEGESLSPSKVVFLPDGGSSGTTVVLAAGPRRIAVSVNWLTGRVVSAELAQD